MRNLLDVDAEMRVRDNDRCGGDRAIAVMFDFQAAFRSVHHAWVKLSVDAANLPLALR